MLLPVFAAIVPRRARITARSHLRALATDVQLAFSQTALLVVFLAHQAWMMADAIARTLFRLFVSRRHLLDWVTAAQEKGSLRQVGRIIGAVIGVVSILMGVYAVKCKMTGGECSMSGKAAMCPITGKMLPAPTE